MTRLQHFPVVAMAVSGVFAGMAALWWTKFRNSHHTCALPFLQSLIQALQENVERMQLEVDVESWNDFVGVLLHKLDAVKKELLRVRDSSELNYDLRGVMKVLDEELLRFLRVEPGVASIVDSYIPRPGQTWSTFLQSKTEDERHLFDDIFREKFLQVKLKEALLDSVEELKSSLEQSCFADVNRTGVDIEPVVETLTRGHRIVKVLFATDRVVTADGEYIGKISRRTLPQLQGGVPLQYGWAQVGIPVSHKTGSLEAPGRDSKEEADPSKHIVIFSVNTRLRGDLGGFLECVKKDLATGQEIGELLVYIHGYNVSHIKALKRAAQLKNDLGFQGTVILYSWSSKGTLDGYYADEKNVKTTAVSLKLFLKSIMHEVNAPRAHILAHSMGNRALIEALHCLHEEREGNRPLSCPLSQIIFVAADEERSRFEKLVRKINETYQSISPVEPASLSNSNESSSTGGTDLNDRRPHLSVYCSTEDWPLAMSRMLHPGQRRRLGDTYSLSESTLGDHVDVIDATGIEHGTSKLHHSYHVESPKVIQDIEVLLTQKTPASQRSHLHRIDTYFQGRIFYAFVREPWIPKPATQCL